MEKINAWKREKGQTHFKLNFLGGAAAVKHLFHA
jgi:hypothetical protein